MLTIEPSNAWLETSLGQTVLTEENRLLGAAVRRMHGDTLLWAGVSAGTAGLSRRSMVRHRIFAGVPGIRREELARAAADDMSPYVAQLSEIPLRNNCVDAMVLHHTLELCLDPRAALREAARVLQPGGQLVICAFNQLGLFSCCRAFASVPECFLNPGRVRDWLDVLGFESMAAAEHALFRPPWGMEEVDSARWTGLRRIVRRLPLPLGNVFILHVRKKSLSIRPDWRAAPRRRVALAGVAYPKFVDTQHKVP